MLLGGSFHQFLEFILFFYKGTNYEKLANWVHNENVFSNKDNSIA